MDVVFTELCKLFADARGLKPDFWKTDPLYIRLSRALSAGSVADTVGYEVVAPDGIASFIVDIDKDGNA